MKHSRYLLALSICLLVLTIPSFAATPSVSPSGTSATMVDGPAPVPICPPEQKTCDTLPMPGLVDGPAPVPICPPEQKTCDTLPMPGLVDGPAPVPICPPEEGRCNTLPIPRPIATDLKDENESIRQSDRLSAGR